MGEAAPNVARHRQSVDGGLTLEEHFHVWQFFEDDTYERVGTALPAKEAVALAKSYTTRPAATLGIIKQVMITDSGDCCVFLWKNGEGVVHPARTQP